MHTYKITVVCNFVTVVCHFGYGCVPFCYGCVPFFAHECFFFSTPHSGQKSPIFSFVDCQLLKMKNINILNSNLKTLSFLWDLGDKSTRIFCFFCQLIHSLSLPYFTANFLKVHAAQVDLLTDHFVRGRINNALQQTDNCENFYKQEHLA